MTNKKVCLDCQEPIKGRADKKFCSDQCRNNYNNRLNRNDNNYIRNINRLLKKNRSILSSLNPDGKATVHKDKLATKGFNFNYHTNTYTTKAGKVYYFCYELGYLVLDSGYVTIVRREEYVD